jgi:GNAT superfamily N-acetyltransferase
METITFKRAGESDIPTMIQLRIEFFEEHFGKQEAASEQTLREHLDIYFRKALNNSSYISWIAEAEGLAVGIGGMVIRERAGNFKNPEGKDAYIMSMFTRPAYRRKGISTGILNRLVNSGREMGIRFFELHATPEGEPVYLKNGFLLHPEPTYRKYIE